MQREEGQVEIITSGVSRSYAFSCQMKGTKQRTRVGEGLIVAIQDLPNLILVVCRVLGIVEKAIKRFCAPSEGRGSTHNKSAN